MRIRKANLDTQIIVVRGYGLAKTDGIRSSTIALNSVAHPSIALLKDAPRHLPGLLRRSLGFSVAWVLLGGSRSRSGGLSWAARVGGQALYSGRRL